MTTFLQRHYLGVLRLVVVNRVVPYCYNVTIFTQTANLNNMEKMSLHSIVCSIYFVVILIFTCIHSVISVS